MKVWDGNSNSWVNPFFAYPKIWNGSNWVYGRPRIWTGSGWSMLPNDSKTVTVGSGIWSEAYVGSGTAYGYWRSGGTSYNTIFGNISPNNSSQLVDSGGSYTSIVYDSGTTFGNTPYYEIILNISFNDQRDQFGANDWGWNTLTIGSYSYSRAASTYIVGSGSAQWTWNLTSADPNPFGTTVGANVAVSFS